MDLGGNVSCFGAYGDFLFAVGGIRLRKQAFAYILGGNAGKKNCRYL